MKPENKPQQATAGPKTRIHNRRTINISLAAEHIDKARRTLSLRSLCKTLRAIPRSNEQ